MMARYAKTATGTKTITTIFFKGEDGVGGGKSIVLQSSHPGNGDAAGADVGEISNPLA